MTNCCLQQSANPQPVCGCVCVHDAKRYYPPTTPRAPHKTYPGRVRRGALACTDRTSDKGGAAAKRETRKCTRREEAVVTAAAADEEIAITTGRAGLKV
ncbi:unnamed protein product [Mesocestoides corti]|uniref:Uncharacterized protein n=1 Tax=Mesocestoides corti TaxID=53468 RepID=A0A0R3UNF1_MESCO|nr:unnamed protein product [Mesocestoides corti]